MYNKPKFLTYLHVCNLLTDTPRFQTAALYKLALSIYLPLAPLKYRVSIYHSWRLLQSLKRRLSIYPVGWRRQPK